eukprot:1180846-Prorocentrum_minimum.AAC.1
MSVSPGVFANQNSSLRDGGDCLARLVRSAGICSLPSHDSSASAVYSLFPRATGPGGQPGARAGHSAAHLQQRLRRRPASAH